MVLWTCGNLFHQTQSGFVEKKVKGKKAVYYIMRSWFLWLCCGLCVNILINGKDFLRLRLETLQVTYKFTCSFSEIFYLAHSFLIPLQSLSSFWRPNITSKANPPFSPSSPFSLCWLTCMYCYMMLSCHPEISPTTIIKNTNSHPDNDTTPIKLWVFDEPLDLPKRLVSIFLKISERRSNVLSALVIASSCPVHLISRGQSVCLLVLQKRDSRGEAHHLLGSFFCGREKVLSWQALTYPSESHLFLQISSIFYHCIQKNNYLGKTFHM